MVEMEISTISHFFLKYDFVVLLFQKMKLVIFYQYLLESKHKTSFSLVLIYLFFN
eukprot:UN23743